MLAADTNVLVRILIDDPDAPRQCAAARRERQDEAYGFGGVRLRVSVPGSDSYAQHEHQRNQIVTHGFGRNLIGIQKCVAVNRQPLKHHHRYAPLAMCKTGFLLAKTVHYAHTPGLKLVVG